jgi:hypothetical protein
MAKHPKRPCEPAQLAASVPCDHDGSTDRVGGRVSRGRIQRQIEMFKWGRPEQRVIRQTKSRPSVW